jgi:hypothetical protein
MAPGLTPLGPELWQMAYLALCIPGAVWARGLPGKADWRRVWGIRAGAAVVVGFSFSLIARMGEDLARMAVSGKWLDNCLIMAHGQLSSRGIRRPGTVIAGMASGMAKGTAAGGLPIAVFMAVQPVQAPVFRATLIAYLTLVCLLALPSPWWTGLLSWQSFVLLAFTAPLMALGRWVGGRCFTPGNPQDSRKFTPPLLPVLATLGLPGSLA